MSLPHSVTFAGVDLGGTNFSVALADATGCIVAETREPTLSADGPETVLRRIATTINRLVQKVGSAPVSCGIGVPGLVDVPTGTTLFLPNLPGNWVNVPVATLLEAQIGCPVHVLNDARAATLGELAFGHGRNGAKTFALFTLGTGVGGGLVINGQLHLGSLGSAGEIGHLTFDPNGPWCGCGNRGCIETIASGPALTGEAIRLLLSGLAPHLHALSGGDPAKVTPALLATAAEAGDLSARRAIERAGEALGVAGAHVCTTLHPEMMVLGGGVSALSEMLIPSMRRIITERVRMLPTSNLLLVRSQLGDNAGTLGGIATAIKGGKIDLNQTV